MVDQEVRYLLGNTEYSWVANDNLIVNMTFENFTKTDGNKIGVNIRVHLSSPHWDNDYRLEESFKGQCSTQMMALELVVGCLCPFRCRQRVSRSRRL